MKNSPPILLKQGYHKPFIISEYECNLSADKLHSNLSFKLLYLKSHT